jgi:hypothetical protein
VRGDELPFIRDRVPNHFTASALRSLRQLKFLVVRRGYKVLASCIREKQVLRTIFAMAVASLIFLCNCQREQIDGV